MSSYMLCAVFCFWFKFLWFLWVFHLLAFLLQCISVYITCRTVPVSYLFDTCCSYSPQWDKNRPLSQKGNEYSQGSAAVPSVLWRCWLGFRKCIWPVKIWLMRCWRGYLLEQSAISLHMVQLMPLPPHRVCFSKIRDGLSFWHQLTWVVPDKGS